MLRIEVVAKCLRIGVEAYFTVEAYKLLIFVDLCCFILESINLRLDTSKNQIVRKIYLIMNL